MDAQLKNKLIDQLIIDEGLKTKLYRDTAGKLTGGIGHNFDDKGISENVARFICSEDINECEQDLNKHLSWWTEKPDNVKLVLLNMCFNLGIYGLLKFENTLDLIKNNDLTGAAKEVLNSKWSVQVGDRANRLSKLLEDGNK